MAQAIKASGAIVEVGPEDFMNLMDQDENPLIVVSQGGAFKKYYQYLAGYHGLVFYAKSTEMLNNINFVNNNEVIYTAEFKRGRIMYYENERGKIYYEVHGEEDNAPVVVFSHGICMDHKTFIPQVEALKDRYRAIIWDMPYHGMSSPMDYRVPFTVTAAEFIVELLDYTGTDKAILVGQSLGSFVTQQVAHRHPNRVRATVHIGGGSLYPGYTPLLKLLNPLISLFITLYPSKSVFKAFASHRALKPETRAYMEQVAARTGKKVLSHITQELLRDMVKGLPEPSKETMLLLYGDHEAPFVKRLLRKMNHNNPNSQLAVVSDAHHIANQDNPEEFNKILLSFLDELLANKPS